MDRSICLSAFSKSYSPGGATKSYVCCDCIIIENNCKTIKVLSAESKTTSCNCTEKRVQQRQTVSKKLALRIQFRLYHLSIISFLADASLKME